MKWTDSEDIGIALSEKFPDQDPLVVRFTDLRERVMGLDGFEFCEFTSPDPDRMAAQLEQFGFVAAARHLARRFAEPSDRLELDREHRLLLRERHQIDPGRGDHRQRALGPDEQREQVGPWRIDDRAVERHQLAVRPGLG